MHSWWQSLAVVARDSGEMVPVLRFPPQRSFFFDFFDPIIPLLSRKGSPHTSVPSSFWNNGNYLRQTLPVWRKSFFETHSKWMERKEALWETSVKRKQNHQADQSQSKNINVSTTSFIPASCMHSLTFSHHFNDVSHHHRSGGKIHVYQRKSQERPKIMGNIGKTQLSIRTTEIE